MTITGATCYVDSPFSATIEYAEAGLKQRPELTISQGPALSEEIRVRSRVVDDTTDEARMHDALEIRWSPKHYALFPNFQGLLTVRPHQRGSYLRIEGAYEPPLGILGRIFDALIGRTIARLTLARLLRDLRIDIEARNAAFVAERRAAMAKQKQQG